MAGRAKFKLLQKHLKDMVKVPIKCETGDCPTEFAYLSSYKRHLLVVHKMAKKKVELIISDKKKDLFPDDDIEKIDEGVATGGGGLDTEVVKTVTVRQGSRDQSPTGDSGGGDDEEGGDEEVPTKVEEDMELMMTLGLKMLIHCWNYWKKKLRMKTKRY